MNTNSMATRRGIPLTLLIAFALSVWPAATAQVSAATCDANPADATQVTINPVPIAPAGSLAPSTSAQVSVTSVNSAGQCVSGATVSLFLAPQAGGSAVTNTTACPYGRLTPNWLACTTDANGQILVWYTTPSTLPNGGTDSIEATLSPTAGSVVETSYTYGSLQVSGQPINAMEGSQFSGTVATITQHDLSNTTTLSAQIGWGDGMTSAATVNFTPSGIFVTGTHVYAEETPGGSALVTNITVSATGGPSAAGNGLARVADAPLSAIGGLAFNGRVGKSLTVTVATFTDADPGAALGDYAAQIDWGDGTTSQGTVAVTTGAFSVTGTHTYRARGSYVITVSIQDAGGATARVTDTATITSKS